MNKEYLNNITVIIGTKLIALFREQVEAEIETLSRRGAFQVTPGDMATVALTPSHLRLAADMASPGS